MLVLVRPWTPLFGEKGVCVHDRERSLELRGLPGEWDLYLA